MRLISCRIENFGQIHEQNYDFKEGMNAYCFPNGSGKSTLSVFLYAMFYGLEPRKGKYGIHERAYYMPWQGGVCGGKLRYEQGGKEYLLQKTFGSKPSEDVTELFDGKTGIAISDLSLADGLTLFKMDAESFARTIFSVQSEVYQEQYSNDQIASRVGSVDALDFDLQMADQATALLKDRLNYLSPNSKKGLVSKTKEEADGLRKKLSAKPELEKELTACRKEKKEKKERLAVIISESDALTEKQKELGRLKDLQKDASVYQSLSADKESREQVLKTTREMLPEEIPDRNVLEDTAERIRDFETLKKLREAVEWSSSKEDSFKQLKNKYGDFSLSELPTDEEKEKVSNSIRLFEDLRTSRKNRSELAVDAQALQAGEDHFSSGHPSMEEIDEKIASLGKLEELKSDLHMDYEELKYAEEELERHRGSVMARFIPGFVVGALLIVAGGVGLALSYNLPGILALVAGLIAVVITVVLFASSQGKQKKKYQAAEENLLVVKKRMEEKDAELSERKKKIAFFLQQYNYAGDAPMYQMLLWDMKNTLRDYIRNKELAGKQGADCEALDKQMEEEEKKIQAFFIRYHLSLPPVADYWNKKEEVFREIADYKVLCQQEEQYQKYTAQINALQEKISNTFTEYKLSQDGDLARTIEDTKMRLNTYETALKEFQEAENKLKKFEEEKEEILIELKKILPELIGGEVQDDVHEEAHEEETLAGLTERMEELRKEEKDIHTELLSLEQKEEGVARNLEELEADAERLEQLSSSREESRKEWETAKYAQEYLLKAKEEFQAEYLRPVEEGFMKYYGYLREGAEDAFPIDPHACFDATFALKIEEQNKQRDIKCLSAGMKDYLGICMRLAMTDAMYKGEERPFIVLDDPFVNLDDQKLPGAKNLLQKLSEESQVFYFTCRKENMPES